MPNKIRKILEANEIVSIVMGLLPSHRVVIATIFFIEKIFLKAFKIVDSFLFSILSINSLGNLAISFRSFSEYWDNSVKTRKNSSMISFLFDSQIPYINIFSAVSKLSKRGLRSF